MAEIDEKPPRIPVFKTSGNLSADLKNILVSEIIGFGAWRGRIRRYLEDNGNTVTLQNGDLAYSLDEKFNEGDLDLDRTSGNNTFVQNMLEGAGMDKEGIASFKDDMQDEEFKLYWKGEIAYNSEILENTQDWIDAQVLEADVAYFKLEYSPKKYQESSYPTREDRPDFLFRKLVSDPDLYDELSNDIARLDSGVYEDPPLPYYSGTAIQTLTLDSFLDSITLRLYNSLDEELVDIPETLDIDEGYEELNKVLKIMTLISSENLFSSRTIESYTETDEDVNSTNFKVHNVVERWDLTYVENFAVDNIDVYHIETDVHIEQKIILIHQDPFQADTYSEENGIKYIDIFWKEIKDKVDSISDFSIDIFVKEDGEVYLTDRGIRSGKPEDLAKAFSDNFGVEHVPKKSSKWLRILIIIILIVVVVYSGGQAIGAVKAMVVTVPSIVSTVVSIVSFLGSLQNLFSFLKGPNEEDDSGGIEEDESTDNEIEDGCDDEYDTFCQYNRPQAFDNNGEIPNSTSFEKMKSMENNIEQDMEKFFKSIDK